MKVYTSYFANSKTLAKNGIRVIGIAQWPPKWFYGMSLKTLAPPVYLLRGDYTEEEYIEHYRRSVLSRVNGSQLMQELERMSGGLDIALCCYEKPGEFCHRHLLSEHLRNQGFDVSEFEDPNAKKKESVPVPPQPSLFD